MPKVNSKTYVYHPRDFKRASRYLASGRLRPLRSVLVSCELAKLRVRWTKWRPLGYRERWPSVAWNAIPRNGHQDRRDKQLRAAVRALRHQPAARHVCR